MKACISLVLLLVASSPSMAADDPPSLRRAITVYSFAVAADKATTIYGLSACSTCMETNPLYRWSGNDATTIAVSTAIDVTSIWAWQRFVGRKYPTLAKIGLYGWSGVRGGLAVHNVRIAHRRK